MSEAGMENAGKFRTHIGVLAGVVNGLYFLITLLGAAWSLQVQHMFGVAVFREQYLGLVLGTGLVAVFLAVKARKGEAEGRGVPWYDELWPEVGDGVKG